MNCAVIQQMVKSQWSFKTSFWGMYQLDSDGPVLYSRILTAIIWNYSFIPENTYMAAADTVCVDDDFARIGETTEEEVPEDTLKRKSVRCRGAG